MNLGPLFDVGRPVFRRIVRQALIECFEQLEPQQPSFNIANQRLADLVGFLELFERGVVLALLLLGRAFGAAGQGHGVFKADSATEFQAAPMAEEIERAAQQQRGRRRATAHGFLSRISRSVTISRGNRLVDSLPLLRPCSTSP